VSLWPAAERTNYMLFASCILCKWELTITVKADRLSRLVAIVAAASTLGCILVSPILDATRYAGLRWLGLLALVPAVVCIFKPFLDLRRYGRAPSDKTYMDTTDVADRGLYAVVRHPQYLGYMLLATGLALESQHIASLLLAASSIASFWLLTIYEERDCINRFGPEYRQYKERVPRFNALLGTWRWGQRHLQATSRR